VDDGDGALAVPAADRAPPSILAICLSAPTDMTITFLIRAAHRQGLPHFETKPQEPGEPKGLRRQPVSQPTRA